MDRPNSALLVVDVQQGVVAEAYRRDAVVETIRRLVDRARAEDTPVVWVQHADDELVPHSDAWQIVPELAPTEREPVIGKRYGDSFEDTPLDRVLADLDVGRVVVAGAQTDACIRSTIHGALTRGYDTILVSDAHTTEDLTPWGAPPPEQVIAHTNMYWSQQSAPGRTAGTAPAGEVELTRRAG